MPELFVTVNEDGSIEVEFDGFQGSSCLDEADRLYSLLQELGIDISVTRFEPKPELLLTEPGATARQSSNVPNTTALG